MRRPDPKCGRFQFVILVFALLALAITNRSTVFAQESSVRKLENSTRLSKDEIQWDWITFDPNNRLLIAQGESPLTNPGRHVGMTRETREYLQVWDLATFRVTSMELWSNQLARRVTPRFTAGGELIYGHARENQFRDYLDENREGNSRSPERFATRFMLWKVGEESPSDVGLNAKSDGLFAASHVSQDQRKLWLVEPSVGIQEFSLSWNNGQPSPNAAPKAAPGRRGFGGQMKFGPTTRKPHWEVKPVGEPVPLGVKIEQPIQFSADGSMLVACVEGLAPELIVWDVAAKKERVRLKPARPAQANRAALEKRRRAKQRDAGRGKLDSENTTTEFLALSRDASVIAHAASDDRGSVAWVYDVKTGKVIDRIDPEPKALSGLSLSADGKLLASVVDGKANVQSIGSDKKWSLQDPGTRLSVCMLSPDGALLAAGGTDGHMRLWKIPDRSPSENRTPSGTNEKASEPKIASRPGSDASNLMPLGPREVRVTYSDGKTQTLSLVRLTAGEALFSPKGGGALKSERSDDTKITKIETVDGKYTWQHASKLFTGDKLDVPTVAKIQSNKSIDRDQEIAYLHWSIRRLLGSAVQLASEPGNRSGLDQLKRVIQTRQSRTHQLGGAASQAIAKLLGELTQSIDQIAKSENQSRRALDDLNALMIKIAQDRSKSNAEMQLQWIEGLSTAALGSMTWKETVEIRDYGRTIEHIYVEHTLFPGLAEAGTTTMLHTLNDVMARQVKMAATESIANQEIKDRLIEAERSKTEAIDRILSQWESLATKDLGMPPAPPLPDTKGRLIDQRQLGEWTARDAARIRSKLGRVEPMSQADEILLLCTGSNKPNDAAALFKRAREVEALVADVPPGTTYDFDRAMLFAMAAELALRASSMESGKRSLASAYNLKAAYAAQLLDQAVPMLPDDATGLLRRQRCLALAQSGQVEAAVRQARRLITDVPNSALAHVVLARVLCATQAFGEGLDHLEEAIVKLDYREIANLRTLDDFPLQNPRFKSLTEIVLEVEGSGISQQVSIRNKSLFALRDVTFELKYFNTYNRKNEINQKQSMQRLGSEEKLIVFCEAPAWKINNSEGSKFSMRWNGGLTVTTNGQGTVTVPVLVR